MNYCDYDSLQHYKSGSFSSKYKTSLVGKLKTIKKQALPDYIKSSFLDGDYITYETLEDLILYRTFGLYRLKINNNLYGNPKGASSLGGFASTEFAESLIDVKIRLALNPAWLSTKAYEEKILLPHGSIINVGIVAPVTLKTGTVLEGGADQILLPLNWSEKWIVGYRRVTQRQLMNPPSFSLKKEDLPLIDKKETLYKIETCCFCGGSDVTRLSEAEQLEVIGSKNNHYTMKFRCNNPKCNYYW